MITLIHPEINPVIVSFVELSIRWYGLSYVIGLVIGYYIIKKINKSLINPIDNKVIEEFFIWTALGVIIGGRIGYVLFYQTYSIFYNPLEIFYIWKGGMSFHGGLIGTFFSTILFSKNKNINFYILTDFIVTAVPIGIFFGRIANFINMELYGRVTSFYFAMQFPLIDTNRRHPSQLYEAFFEGLVIFIILIFLIRKNFINNRFGINTSIFLITYGIFRFFLEYLREPDAHIGLLLDYFTMGQLLSIPMIIAGFAIYFLKHKK